MTILTNQFVDGGLLLMGTGALMALLRDIPKTCYEWLKNRFSVSLVIFDTDPLFDWTKMWFDSLPYSRRARAVSCELHRDADEEEFEADRRVIFAPSYGNHFFRHGGRLVWLSRKKGEVPQGASLGRVKSSDAITVTVLGCNQGIVRDLVREIMDSAAAFERQTVRGYISTAYYWRRLPTFRPRDLATVDMPQRDEARVLSAIEKFLASGCAYADRGIPYHFNLLFAGTPGTGKTSFAAALCGRFGLSLYILNIAGPGMNDEHLVELMLSLPRKSLLLLEDVDAVVPQRRSKPRLREEGAPTASDDAADGVTLSGLLNCMDGLTSPDGVVIVMTTNHPESLDPALLRPGRIDMRLDFGPATREQIERMHRRLLPGVLPDGRVDSMLARTLTMAQVQSELIATEDVQVP